MMVYAYLTISINLSYSPSRSQIWAGEIVKIDIHRNGDEVYSLDGAYLGFFPKDYIKYIKIKPSMLLNLVMK